MFSAEDNQEISFEAKLITDDREDIPRRFAIKYNMNDSSITILNVRQRGMNYPARFLAKTVVENPDTGKPYECRDFYVGAQLIIAGRLFEILSAPEYTLSLMESRSDRFPMADLTNAVDSLKGVVSKANLEAEFKAVDTRNSGVVPEAAAKQILGKYAPPLVEHLVITLMRRFLENGNFDYSTLLHFLN